MDYKLYAFILITKIIENALGTLRLIVVSNGKKWVGALLNGVIAIIWIIATGMVIIDVDKDPIKIIFFCIGSIIGSYLGSLMEEKMAMGKNRIIAITNYDFGELITRELRKEKYSVTNTIGNGQDNLKSILIIITPRKKTQECVSLISCIDPKAMIVSESITMLKEEITT